MVASDTAHLALLRLLMQKLRRDVAVAAGKEQLRERHALPRGPKPCAAQPFGDVVTGMHGEQYMGKLGRKQCHAHG